MTAVIRSKSLRHGLGFRHSGFQDNESRPDRSAGLLIVAVAERVTTVSHSMSVIALLLLRLLLDLVLGLIAVITSRPLRQRK